ncbi:MAG: hypothetical protein ABIH83_04285, partial [Candidatus Micrarchaeota archaeon]
MVTEESRLATKWLKLSASELLDLVLNKIDIYEETKNLNKTKKIDYLVSSHYDILRPYVDFLQRSKYSSINKSLFFKETFKLLKNNSAFDKNDKNYVNLVLSCIVNDVHVESIDKLFHQCKIRRNKNIEIYKLKTEHRDPDLKKIGECMKRWNKENEDKIKIYLDSKDDGYYITVSKEFGVRTFWYFKSRTKPDTINKTTIHPIKRYTFHLYRDKIAWMIKGKNNLESEKSFLFILNHIFGQEVAVEKNKRTVIQKIERTLRESKDCSSLFNKVNRIRDETIRKIE